MAGSSVHNSTFKAVFHTANITDGGMATGTILGNIAPGSFSVERNDPVSSGQGISVATGASRQINFNVLGAGASWIAAVQTATNANPPTTEYLFVTNISGTGYTRYGPGNFNRAYRKGKGGDPEKQSVAIGFYVEGDTAEDIEVEYDVAVTYV